MRPESQAGKKSTRKFAIRTLDVAVGDAPPIAREPSKVRPGPEQPLHRRQRLGLARPAPRRQRLVAVRHGELLQGGEGGKVEHGGVGADVALTRDPI